jgi:hypothetical protein
MSCLDKSIWVCLNGENKFACYNPLASNLFIKKMGISNQCKKTRIDFCVILLQFCSKKVNKQYSSLRDRLHWVGSWNSG